jgi:hypothetical protein
LFLALCAHTLCAEEIDRLVAAVSGRVVTESDLALARKLNAILELGQGNALPSREKEIDRLIDLELIRQELESFPVVAEDEGRIEARMQELKNSYAEIGGLPGLLSMLGLQESELLEYVRLQDSILRFVDFRFRPFANVSEQEIQDYYEGRYTAALKRAGISIPPLASVSAEIEELLKQEKVTASMNQWLQDIRRHSRIEHYLGGDEPPWVGK